MGGQYHSQKTWVIKQKSQYKVWDTVLQFTGKGGPGDLQNNPSCCHGP